MNQETSQGSAGAAGIYSFMDMVAGEAEAYAVAHTSPMSPLLEEIEAFTLTSMPYPSMLTGRVEGRFLQLITRLTQARRVVEIGTFTGYSALAMAEALPDNGRILTIEHNPEHARIARRFFAQSPAGGKITLREGEALDILESISDSATDLVLIDADIAGRRLDSRRQRPVVWQGPGPQGRRQPRHGGIQRSGERGFPRRETLAHRP
jgi:hypothetical protein